MHGGTSRCIENIRKLTEMLWLQSLFPACLQISRYIANYGSWSAGPVRSPCVTEPLAPPTTHDSYCPSSCCDYALTRVKLGHSKASSFISERSGQQWNLCSITNTFTHTHTHNVSSVSVHYSSDGKMFFTPTTAEMSPLFFSLLYIFPLESHANNCL